MMYAKMKANTLDTNQTVGRAICSHHGPNIGPFHPPRNRIVASDETVTMLAYSARKNMANFMPLYSVCQPATSSCSDSARSNGRRLVSATALMTYTKKATGWRKKFHRGMNPNHVPCWLVTSCA